MFAKAPHDHLLLLFELAGDSADDDSDKQRQNILN
jgi:hypothetical protein